MCASTAASICFLTVFEPSFWRSGSLPYFCQGVKNVSLNHQTKPSLWRRKQQRSTRSSLMEKVLRICFKIRTKKDRHVNTSNLVLTCSDCLWTKFLAGQVVFATSSQGWYEVILKICGYKSRIYIHIFNQAKPSKKEQNKQGRSRLDWSAQTYY